MPYPDEILASLAEENSLLAGSRSRLREMLLVPGMRYLLEEARVLDPRILLKKSDPSGQITLLSNLQARMLTSIFEEIKDTPTVRENIMTLADMVVWFSHENTFCAYLVSPLTAKEIANNPDKYIDSLKNLRLLAQNSTVAFFSWTTISTAIAEVQTMKDSEFHKRSLYAEFILPKIISSLADMFLLTAANNLLFFEVTQLSQLVPQYMRALTEAVEDGARAHFTSHFRKLSREIEDMAFTPKTDGGQLGTQLRIQYRDQENTTKSITYYIKTHQNGSKIQTTGTKPVDLKELLVYKILESTGHGAKVLFFLNNCFINGMFIASQDLNFTKSPNKIKYFKTLGFLKENNELKLDDETCKGVGYADILSRIFRLHDIVTNASNFGRLTVNNEHNKWKILDFRVYTNPIYDNNTIFEDYKAACGAYAYTGFLAKVARDRNESERIDVAFHVLTELEMGKKRLSQAENKMPLLPAIEQSYAEIVALAEQNSSGLGFNSVTLINALYDLERYKEDAKHNFIRLRADVEEYRAKAVREPSASLILSRAE